MYSFTQSIYWVQTIAFQGARVISAHERQAPVSLSNRARMEEQFFLNACEKAVRWVNVLSSEGRDEEIRQYLPVDAIRDFKHTMISNDIRNLREHEEEYLKTRGRSLEGEMVDVSRPEGGPTIRVAPGVTVLGHGDIVIGGRLSVRKAIQAAQNLNTALVAAQHAHVRSKRKRLSNAIAEDYPHVFAPKEIS